MLKKNLLYNYLLAISQFIFPLVTFPYSSRILGPEGIGSVNFIDSFTQYAILFAALGIPLYGVREISKLKDHPEKLSKTFSEIFLIHICSALLFSLIYLIAAHFVPALKNHYDLVWVGIAIVVSGVLSAEWLFQGLEQFAYVTIRTLLVRCLSVLLLFIFLKPASDPIVYYLLLASGGILNGLVNVYYLRKLVKIRFNNLDLKRHMRPLMVILGSTLAVSVYVLMDTVILGFLKGDKAVGIYATALRVVRLPLAMVAAVTAVIVPGVSRAFEQKDFEGIRLLIHKSFSLICLIGFPVAMGLYVSADFLIHLFAGDQFAEASLPLKIMSAMVLLNGMASILFLQLLAPLGKEKYLLKSYFIGMLFSISSNILLIHFYSYTGAAIGIMLTEGLTTALAYYFLTKTFKISFDRKIMLQCLIGALFFFPIAILLKHLPFNTVINELSVIVTCILFYACYISLYIKNPYVQAFKQSILIKFSRS
ncbi:flippase [Pedobacter sp. MC2016-14]|uniref:flippase n=1 Tax=Pedobacter sp. MC2016-14 TaxID=2897327 RepID=UPI001E4EF032|nr:flippase [Pedobacter sp. MC2016-14]MCD0486948.1 flippase [Pedobacter sp. MC2016-14]